MKQNYSFSIFLLLCLCVQQGFAQITFTAKVDAAQVVQGDYVQVTFTMSNADMTSFTPPKFKGFEQLGTSQSSNFEYVNGKMSRATSQTYTLQGKRPGKYTIGAATATVKGKKYQTKPLKIEVLKTGSKGTKEKAFDRINDGTAVLMRAEVDTTTVYLGQGIELDYTLYTSVNINRLNLVQEPEYPGFYAVDVKQFPNEWKVKEINGINYQYKPVKRVALFPQKTGLLEINPITIQTRISVQGQRRGVYEKVSSDVLQLNVKPLPEAGKPENFSGAIGEYDVRIAGDNTKTIAVNDAYTIRITILGAGDLKQIQAPDLGISLDDFEVYDPKISEQVYENQGKVSGTKTFEYVILPKRKGRFNIKPAFAFFNPKLGEYVTKAPAIIRLNVVQGKSGQNFENNDAITEAERLKNQEILPLKTASKLYTQGRGFFWSIPYFCLLMLPLVAIGAAIVRRQKLIALGLIDPSVIRMQGASKVAQERLTKAKTHLDNGASRDFYDEISHALWGYVGDKLGIPLSELTKENVREKLSQKNVSSADNERFVSLLNTCEMALFAGMDNTADMSKTYTQASEVIISIEESVTNKTDELE